MGRDQKIKVCHLISGDLWAGAEVQACILLKQLARRSDLEVNVIILNEGKLADKLRAEGIEVLVIDESQNSFFRILRSARKHLSERNIDIVHSHRRKENVLAGLLKRSGHTRHLIQTVHGAPEPFTGFDRLKEWFYMRLDRYFTNRYFDHILPVSDDLGRLLQKQLTRGRLTTIHNSIELDRVVPQRSAGQVRRQLGLDESNPVIGSAGRMVPVKAYDVFIRAAGIILDSSPNAAFVLAGDGSELEKLKALAGELGISDKIVFAGFRDDVIDVLNCLDIFVVSSHHEGVPTVVLESMALQKSVVSTAVGGINEMLENGVSALLVKPGDPQTIASACLKLLNDDSLKAQLGDSARKTVENRFSAEKQTGMVAKIYRELMDRTKHE